MYLLVLFWITMHLILLLLLLLLLLILFMFLTLLPRLINSLSVMLNAPLLASLAPLWEPVPCGGSERPPRPSDPLGTLPPHHQPCWECRNAVGRNKMEEGSCGDGLTLHAASCRWLTTHNGSCSEPKLTMMSSFEHRGMIYHSKALWELFNPGISPGPFYLLSKFYKSLKEYAQNCV